MRAFFVTVSYGIKYRKNSRYKPGFAIHLTIQACTHTSTNICHQNSGGANMQDNWELSGMVTYRLERFRSARDPSFLRAVQIYLRNTPPSLRTNTNEIAHWLEHFRIGLPVEFYVFGFLADNDVIGYAELAYIASAHLFAVDYLVIDEQYRGNNTFFEFSHQLRAYLTSAHPEYRYVVAEVAHASLTVEPSPQSRLMIRLLKLQGFHVIRAPYFQPALGLDNLEGELRASLLVHSIDELPALRTTTYLAIVQALYFEYYLPWYTLYAESCAAYEQRLHDRLQDITGELRDATVVLLNGHHTLLPVPQGQNVVSLPQQLAFAGGILSLLTGFTLLLAWGKRSLGVSDALFAIIYGCLLVTVFAGLATVSPRARFVFTTLLATAERLAGSFSKTKKTLEAKERKMGTLPKTSRRDHGAARRSLPVTRSTKGENT
ncbi:MAG: hypothetical protein ABIT01_01005 [Thermoanaerobaculia bacterium]